MNHLGSPPQTSGRLPRKNVAGAPPPDPRWGLLPPEPLLNGVWGRASGALGRTPAGSSGEAARGFGAEPQPSRPPFLATALVTEPYYTYYLKKVFFGLRIRFKERISPCVIPDLLNSVLYVDAQNWLLTFIKPMMGLYADG